MEPSKNSMQYFFKMSQNRYLRRKLAKQLGMMKHGWQNVKEEFPPYNKPMDLGINKFKKAGHSYKDVVEYKQKSYGALSNK